MIRVSANITKIILVKLDLFKAVTVTIIEEVWSFSINGKKKKKKIRTWTEAIILADKKKLRNVIN